MTPGWGLRTAWVTWKAQLGGQAGFCPREALQDACHGGRYKCSVARKGASTITLSYLELVYISQQVKGDRLEGTGFDQHQEKAL